MLGKTCVVGVHEWKAQLEEVCHVQSQLILRLEVPKKTHFWCADEVDDMLNKMGVNGMSSSMLDALKKGTSEEDLKKALAEQAGRSLVAAIFCSWCLTPVWLTGVTGWWMIHFDSNKTCFQVWFSGHYQQPWVLVMFCGPEYARKNQTSWRFFCFSSFFGNGSTEKWKKQVHFALAFCSSKTNCRFETRFFSAKSRVCSNKTACGPQKPFQVNGPVRPWPRCLGEKLHRSTL